MLTKIREIWQCKLCRMIYAACPAKCGKCGHNEFRKIKTDGRNS